MLAVPPLARLLVPLAASGAALGVALLALVPAADSAASLAHLSPHAALQLRPLDLPSDVYDANGKLLAVLQDADYRSPVALSAVPKVAVRAVLDVEDKSFYQHGAIDIPAILRALGADLSSGHVVQGASTITQQLVKKSILDSRQTFSRKANEALLAFRLQQQMTKNQILQLYLNTVYFGNGAYGIQAASRTYFDEDVGQLSAAQAALLAGVIENPSGYDPILHAQAARQRRNLALDQMVANHDLTRAKAAAAKRVALPTTVHLPGAPRQTTFVEEVVHQLLADTRLGSTPEARYNSLFRGGLQIQTGLDPALQADAEAAVAKGLPDSGGKFTAALVSVDPANGEVRALVPGNNSGVAGFDVVTGLGGGAGRQPGSSFKLFTLMAAIHAGYSIYDTVDGTAPCDFANHGGTPDPYTVQNAEPGLGVMSVTTATANSVNCAYMRLGLNVGLPKVVAMAKSLGNINVAYPDAPSLIIGGLEVHPLDMAAAYATMADGGIYHQPVFVTKVTNRDGQVLVAPPGPGTRVASAQDVAVATSVLQQVVDYGTGTAAALPGRPAAGKTGTTDQFRDAWFDGYTPQLATVVWMGDPKAETSMYDVGGITVYGGTYPAQIWQDFMAAALSGQPVLAFPPPDYSQIPSGQFLKAPAADESANRYSSSYSSGSYSSGSYYGSGSTTTSPDTSTTAASGPAPTTGPTTTTTSPGPTTTAGPAPTTTAPGPTTTAGPGPTTTTTPGPTTTVSSGSTTTTSPGPGPGGRGP